VQTEQTNDNEEEIKWIEIFFAPPADILADYHTGRTASTFTR
jgi:hypothetical protein